MQKKIENLTVYTTYFFIKRPNLHMTSDILKPAKNIDYVRLIDTLRDKLVSLKQTYMENKALSDKLLCLVCSALVLLDLFDLSLIKHLYFLNLVYRTAELAGSYYNKLPRQNNAVDSKDSKNALESLDMLDDIVKVSNNWLIYSSLVVCEWCLHFLVNLLSGFGILMILVLRIMKYLLYMYHCKEFCKSLQSNETTELKNTYIGDELSERLCLSPCIKHLVNVISINNIFCYKIFGVANKKVLSVIDYCLTTSYDALLDTVRMCLVQLSMPETVTRGYIGTATDYLYNLPTNFVSLFRNNKEKKE
jgi:hypothetical protein